MSYLLVQDFDFEDKLYYEFGCVHEEGVTQFRPRSATCMGALQSSPTLSMNSLSYSMQDIPSTITQTIPDEIDRLLLDFQSYPLDTLNWKLERRTSALCTYRAEARKIMNRLQDLRKKFEEPAQMLEAKIDRLTAATAAKEEEALVLETRIHELEENLRRKESELEMWKKYESLVKCLEEINNENNDLLESASRLPAVGCLGLFISLWKDSRMQYNPKDCRTMSAP